MLAYGLVTEKVLEGRPKEFEFRSRERESSLNGHMPGFYNKRTQRKCAHPCLEIEINIGTYTEDCLIQLARERVVVPHRCGTELWLANRQR